MTPPTTTIDGHFEGVGGSRIVWQGWAPVATPRTVIVLVHGAGEHVGRYGYLIAHLLAAGHAVVGQFGNGISHRCWAALVRAQARRCALVERIAAVNVGLLS